MKLLNLLKNLKTSAISIYDIEYDEKYNHFLEMLADPKRIQKVSFDTIMLVLDRRPLSLVPIAYSLKISQLFNSKIVAITQKVHSKMLKQEALKQQTEIKIYEFTTFEFDNIIQVVKKHTPDLIIINQTHTLREKIQSSLKAPMLVVKASQLLDL